MEHRNLSPRVAVVSPFNTSTTQAFDCFFLEMNIIDSTRNLIAGESEIGINDGVSGTWSTQFCGHQLDAGPEFYNVELIMEDYRSNTLSDTDYLWFVGVPGT